MRSRFWLFSAAIVLLALIAFSNNHGVSANNQQQVATALASPGAGSAGTTMPSGTMTVTYPACPSTSTLGMATMSATTSAGTTMTTPVATMDLGGNATAMSPGGYLGVEISIVELCGVRINRLLQDSPAQAAGLQAGDVIVAVDDQSIAALFGSSSMSAGGMATMSATNSGSGANATVMPGATMNATITADNPFLGQVFFQWIQMRSTGETLRLTIQRGGQQMVIPVTLGTIPAGLVTPMGTNMAGGAQPTMSGTTSP